MDLFFEPLAQHHDRAAFTCGEESVDRFLRQHAAKRARLKAATTIVAAAERGGGTIVGFYTLVPHEFRGEELPGVVRKQIGIGSLIAAPGVLLAQLGVSHDKHGQGIGAALLLHALTRCARLADNYGAVAVVTDPIDNRAAKLYRSFDFEPLPGVANRMILPMRRLIAALGSVEVDRLGETPADDGEPVRSGTGISHPGE